MFKIGLHDPFEYLQLELWLKKRLKIEMSIQLLTIKSQESP
jgi:hypothetical protein